MVWKMSRGRGVEAPIEPRYTDAPRIPECRGYETTVLREVGDDEVEYAVSVHVDQGGADAEATVLGRVVRGQTVPDALSGQTLVLTDRERETIREDYWMGLEDARADARADL